MQTIALLDDQFILKVLTANLNKIRVDGRRTILPPPKMTVSEWAERNRVLPETSVEPGRWRTARAPHTRAIMDAVNDARVRQITVMGSAQIGKTELINNVIGYVVDVQPAAIIVMQPTEKDARDYVLQKLEPMIEDTACLREKFSKKKSRDSENSIFRKKFIGGYLTIVSGTAASSLRARSAKITIGDDIDAIRLDITSEGDPILRLIKRSTTFPDHLNFNISTPTMEGESRIDTLYRQGSMERYYVPCPHCEREIVLMEENLVWEHELDMFNKVLQHHIESVYYRCQECGERITESDRLGMLQNGRWVAQKSHISHHRSFWLNELSSTLSSMEKVAKAIIDAGCDVADGVIDTSNANTENAVALWNTVFGRAFPRVRGAEIDPLGLISRVEDFIEPATMTIPQKVLLLTAAVDVQAGDKSHDARLEVKVVGWGRGEEAWIIYRDFIPGNLKDNEVWEALDKLLERRWRRADGAEMRIVITLVDSGFDAETVYRYTTPRYRRNVIASKGANKYGASLLPNKLSAVNKGRTPLLYIGTQVAKHEIFGNLNITEPGDRYIHFSKAWCDPEYFRQLTSEHGVLKRTGLVEYIVFEKIKPGMRNEALDLMVLNYAAMRYMLPNWEAIDRSLIKSIAGTREAESGSRKHTPQPLRESGAGSSREGGSGIKKIPQNADERIDGVANAKGTAYKIDIFS